MTAETQKIYKAYKDNPKFSLQTMFQLSKDDNSGKSLVSDLTEAFHFDAITKQLFKGCGSRPKSADALYINNKICFIEFKRGYKPNGQSNKDYMENIIGSAKDSLETHLDYLKNFPSIQPTESHHLFIAVVNSGKNGRASSALSEALAQRASIDSTLKAELKAQLLNRFQNGCLYSSVDVWNDINFSSRLNAET